MRTRVYCVVIALRNLLLSRFIHHMFDYGIKVADKHGSRVRVRWKTKDKNDYVVFCHLPKNI